jgi:F-type H+-transporting ATPase subunit delta
MSSVVKKVAVPYAEALFTLVKSKPEFLSKAITNDMNIISQLILNSNDLKNFLRNPLITSEVKKNVLKDILTEQATFTALRFVLLLVDRNRIGLLDDIIQKFLELSYKQESIKIAKVTSAIQLSIQQQKNLAEKIKIITHAKQVKLALKINPQLLGGFKVEIGSELIDTSIHGQLKQITNLLKNS